ncbi:lipopolysaccharide heptosyltransferase I [Sulfurospirillum sp. 1307]
MRIAIVKLSALGDIVHAMLVLQYIKNHQIDWIVEEQFAEVLKNNPNINNIITIKLKDNKKNIFKEYKKLKSIPKYDLAIDLQGLIKSSIVSKIVAKKTIGFSKNSLREPIASLLYNQSFDIPYEKNVIERNLELVCKALSIEIPNIKDKNPFLFFKSNLDIKPTLLIIVGSSWESKVYPKEKFVEVINALHVETFLSWGNTQELENANWISSKTHAKVLDKLNLDELKCIISNSKLVIGADSGPTHMAWALGIASITLFGPTPSYRNTIQTNKNKVLDCKKQVDAKRLNKNDFCIKNIAPSEIINIAKELLSVR